MQRPSPMRNALVAIVVMLIGGAQLDASPRGRPTPSERAKPRPRTPPVKPAVKVQPQRVEPGTVLLRYQRVGRELLELQNVRGAFMCADLWLDFRAINLSQALTTPENRVETLDDLVDLHARIERMRGIDVSGECLTNPLADACK